MDSVARAMPWEKVQHEAVKDVQRAPPRRSIAGLQPTMRMSSQRISNSGGDGYMSQHNVGKAAAQRRAGAPVAGEYAKSLVKSQSENVLGNGGGQYAGSTFGKAAAAGRSRSQHTMTGTNRFTHYKDAGNSHLPLHANSRGNLRKAPGCRVDSVPRSGQLPWERRHWAEKKDQMYAPPRLSMSRHGGSNNNGMTTVRTRWGGAGGHAPGRRVRVPGVRDPHGSLEVKKV